MARYEYKCMNCGFKCVIRHSPNKVCTKPCPVCIKPLEKQISKPTVIFKGGGWTPKHYK